MGRLISDKYKQWEEACTTRFNSLKNNEEELNKIFIEIYGLQEELTPGIQDKDVTVRQANLQREIKSLISYIVGCYFGRYSLDEEGLVYAGGVFDKTRYTTIIPDENNILPITDDEYFSDVLVNRVVSFLASVYGDDTLEENMKYIASALGGTDAPRDVIRKYLINDFYSDHLKTYQKRPIYWMIDSGKKNGFKALIYMHRYNSSLLATVRTDYILPLMDKYTSRIEFLERDIPTLVGSAQTKARKELEKVKAQYAELAEFEPKVHHLADLKIEIDLDDGVKHNYELFKDILTPIK